MKRPLFFIPVFLSGSFLVPARCFSQSPFNYGKNKNVFFISASQRKQWGMHVIYKLKQNEKDDGMDLEAMTFEDESINNEWFPFDAGIRFSLNPDSLAANSTYLNGSSYELSNGMLDRYGGYGYGSFDEQEITRYSKRYSLVQTTCAGHCGGYGLRFTKNLFAQNGNILYSVNYPEINDSLADQFLSDSMSIADFDHTIRKVFGKDAIIDTVYYRYDKAGRLVQVINRGEKIDGSTRPEKLFRYSENFSADYFHQYYAGKEKFETFIKRKTGFLPDLILVEIYRYGVFSFLFNQADKKYYSGKTIILEKYGEY